MELEWYLGDTQRKLLVEEGGKRLNFKEESIKGEGKRTKERNKRNGIIRREEEI